MERNSFSNSLEDNSNGNEAIKDNNNKKTNYKLKDSSWSCNNPGFGEDYLAGFSWPPRSYTCSFCKREFRSAQALGGHMNVHRRDRARLRQSPRKDHHGQPPFLNLNLNPNPNPNPNFSSSSSLPSPFSSTFPPLSSLSSFPSSSFPCEMKKWGVNGTVIDPLTSKIKDSRVKELKDYDEFLEKETDQYVTLDLDLDLDLEIGLASDSKEELDLELRLGYS